MTISSTALELRDITRRWPGGPPVFRNLNLQVTPGRITVLLGPSGCGKTTLLRCAASLDPVESGDILVNGVPSPTPGKDRQLILQTDSQLFPWLTVEQNVRFPGHSPDCSPVSHERAMDMLSRTRMAEWAGQYPARLSGGMRQRVVLARTLAAEPEILLLDEPFGALDSETRRLLHLMVNEICRRQNLGVLLVTHDVAEALTLGDELVYMDSSGSLVHTETNPVGGDIPDRDPESPMFWNKFIEVRRRYRLLINAIDP